MTCDDARHSIPHRSSDALGPAAAAALERHLAECAGCGRVAEIEGGFERALRRRLPRGAAPPGLETRLRAALRAEVAARSGMRPAAVRTWAGLLAAAALLAVVLSPLLAGAAGATPGSAFDRVMTVVDRACDGAGVPPGLQHRCRHRGHVNALTSASGSDAYLAIGLDGATGRRVLADPALRGVRLRVEGRLAPDGRTVAIERVRPVGADVS